MIGIEFLRIDDQLSVQVPVGTEPLNAADVRSALAASSYARWQINQHWLEDLIEDYATCITDVAEQRLPNGFLLERPIALRKDATVTFQISDDAMVAKATIVSAWGGSPLSANELVKLAHDAGINFGFQRDQIIHLISQASRAEPGSMTAGIIAVGRVMTPGENSKLVPLVEGLRPRLQRPVANDEQPADLRDFGMLPSVQIGEALVRREPPTPGVDGVTVKGQVQQAPVGQLIPWKPGEGTDFSPLDNDVLIATRNGMPRLAEDTAMVDEIYAVKRVDLSTGHIQFKGAVVINGDVTESMKVVAGGSVFIKGTVEGSLIESGGDIEIGGAIIGHQLHEHEQKHHAPSTFQHAPVMHGQLEHFSTVVKAAGNISCSFAQYARLVADGDIQAMKQLNHCDVTARSVLVGKLEKPAGKILGGTFLLEKSLTAGTVGSPSESVLVVDFNRKITPIFERLQSLRHTAQSIRQDMDEIRRGVETLRHLEKSDSTQLQIQMLVQEFDSQKKILVALMHDIKQLEEVKQQHLTAPGLFVRQQLYAGVEVRIGDEVFLVKSEHSGCKIIYNHDHIGMQPWQG